MTPIVCSCSACLRYGQSSRTHAIRSDYERALGAQNHQPAAQAVFTEDDERAILGLGWPTDDALARWAELGGGPVGLHFCILCEQRRKLTTAGACLDCTRAATENSGPWWLRLARWILKLDGKS